MSLPEVTAPMPPPPAAAAAAAAPPAAREATVVSIPSADTPATASALQSQTAGFGFSNSASFGGSGGPPLVTLGSIAVLAASFFLCTLLPKLYQALVFVPAHTITAHKVWTLVLNVIAEPHFFGFLLSVLLFAAYGHAVELDKGPHVIGMMCGVVTLVTVGITVLLTGILQGLTGQFWTAAAYGGATPAAVTVLMCAWQRAPQGPALVLETGGGGGATLASVLFAAAPSVAAQLQQVRMQFVPFAIVGLCIVHDVLFKADPPTEAEAAAEIITGGPLTFPVVLGLYAAWFHLRFVAKTTRMVQQHTAGAVTHAATTGDPSASMELQYLFPGPLQAPLKLTGELVFPIAHACGVGSAVAEAAKLRARAEANLHRGGSDARDSGEAKPLPGSTQTEAERRRVLALQALSARMEKARAAEAAATASGVANDLDDMKL